VIECFIADFHTRTHVHISLISEHGYLHITHVYLHVCI